MSFEQAEVGTRPAMLTHAFVFYSLTPGRCGYGPNVSELCGALRSVHSPLAERRLRLRSEFLLRPEKNVSISEVIERATQVRLTPEIIEATDCFDGRGGSVSIARAVLEAAGFEVIE